MEGYFKSEEYEDADIIAAKVRELTAGIDLNKFITDSLKEDIYTGISVADANNIDLSEQIFDLIREDFQKNFRICYYILSREKYVDEFLELCDAQIKESDYPRGMGDSLGMGQKSDNELQLDMAVQYLGKFPFKGKKLIKISVNSPIIRWRNMAAVECNDNTKEMWEKLLKMECL